MRAILFTTIALSLAACESVPSLTFRATDAEAEDAGRDGGDAGKEAGDATTSPCDPDAQPPLGVVMCCRNGIGCAGTNCNSATCAQCEVTSGCGPGSLCCTKSTGGAPPHCSGLVIGDNCP